MVGLDGGWIGLLGDLSFSVWLEGWSKLPDNEWGGLDGRSYVTFDGRKTLPLSPLENFVFRFR